uniref:Uncharacterized protein n=1 Tax=Nelumbo nucifera TaxID=4432 RepID=A0A822YY88_NELNU|nr:TPA_asm: hypothetical protein HUJ06_013367 [Nelumbo nucifera]
MALGILPCTLKFKLFSFHFKSLPARKPILARNSNGLELSNGYASSKAKIDFPGKPEADVVVIGSGIAGLCCAGLLARYQQDVLVLESHDLPGGAAHSFEIKGYKFDSGPSLFSGFQSRGPQANPLAQTMCLDPLKRIISLTCMLQDFKSLGAKPGDVPRFIEVLSNGLSSKVWLVTEVKVSLRKGSSKVENDADYKDENRGWIDCTMWNDEDLDLDTSSSISSVGDDGKIGGED